MAEQEYDYDPDTFHPETGEWIGLMLPTDEGGFALVDADNNVLFAVDANNQEVDTEGMVYDAGEKPARAAFDPSDPRWIEVQQEIAALKERVAQPRESIQYQPRGQLRDRPDMVDDDQVVGAWQDELAVIEQQYGHRLTDADKVRLAQRSVLNGDGSLRRAWAELEMEGQGLPDTDTHQGRVDRAVQRLSEADGSAHDAVTGAPAEWTREAESYDTDTSAGRSAKITDKLHGFTDVDERSYSSSNDRAEAEAAAAAAAQADAEYLEEAGF